MERTVLRSRPVAELLARMAKVRLYTDGSAADASANARLQEKRFKTVALPLYVLLDSDGREIARINQAVKEEDFVAFLKKALPAPATP
jgi:thiol:disulfide interchange protein